MKHANCPSVTPSGAASAFLGVRVDAAPFARNVPPYVKSTSIALLSCNYCIRCLQDAWPSSNSSELRHKVTKGIHIPPYPDNLLYPWSQLSSIVGTYGA